MLILRNFLTITTFVELKYKEMQKSPTPNISPLAIEIENKISNAYLYEVAIKNGDFQVRQLFQPLDRISDKKLIQIQNKK